MNNELDNLERMFDSELLDEVEEWTMKDGNLLSSKIVNLGPPGDPRPRSGLRPIMIVEPWEETKFELPPQVEDRRSQSRLTDDGKLPAVFLWYLLKLRQHYLANDPPLEEVPPLEEIPDEKSRRTVASELNLPSRKQKQRDRRYKGDRGPR